MDNTISAKEDEKTPKEPKIPSKRSISVSSLLGRRVNVVQLSCWQLTKVLLALFFLTLIAKSRSIPRTLDYSSIYVLGNSICSFR